MAKSKYFPDLTNGESVADVEQIETAFSLVEKDMENAGEKADQTFSSTSKNAQSGVAIDGELKKYQKKLNFDTAPKQGSTNPVTSDGVWNTWVNLENTMTSKTQSMVDKKVDKETGKSLSTNDYTDAEKQKNANNESHIGKLSELSDRMYSSTPKSLVDAINTMVEEVTGKADKDYVGVQKIENNNNSVVAPWSWIYLGVYYVRGKFSLPTSQGSYTYTFDNLFDVRNDGVQNYQLTVYEKTGITILTFGNDSTEIEKKTYRYDQFITATDYASADRCVLMDRYKFLPSYHYVENEDGDIQNPATDKVRTCTISGNHGKNLIPYPFTNSTKTINGITLTDNGDGTITANGTATDGKAELVIASKASPITIKANTKYTLSGTPSGGASNKWYMYLLGLDAIVSDMGNGGTFTGGDTDTTVGGLIVRVSQGATVENIVFKPMLEESETKTDFEPWCGVGDRTRNLIPYPYTDTTKTMNGITFTDNGDGSVTVNGTATADARVTLKDRKNSYGRWIPKGKYLLSANLDKQAAGTEFVWQGMKDEVVVRQFNTINTPTVIDTTTEYEWDNVFIYVRSGTTVENLTFKPMLIDLDAENLIPYPYARTTQTINGVTLTDNGDGSITVNGTATANVWYPISTRTASTIYATEGKYYLSGCPSGGGSSTYTLNCDVYNGTSNVKSFYESGSGKTQDLNAYDFNILSVNFNVHNGATVNNLTFRPLLVNMDSQAMNHTDIKSQSRTNLKPPTSTPPNRSCRVRV